MAIGTIFSDDFNRANSGTVGNGWVEEGSVNAEILNNKLRLVGAASVTQRVRQPVLTSGEDFTISMQFAMVGAASGTTFGPVVGTMVRVSEIASGSQRGYSAQVGTTTGAAGKVYLLRWDGTAFVEISSSGSSLAYTAGDVIEVSITTSKYTITASGRNVTQGGSAITVTGTLTNDTGSNLIPGPRDPAVWIIGGTCDVSQFTFTNNADTASRYVFIGDSITHGASSASLAARFSTIVAAGLTGRTCFNYAAASAVTANMISSATELNLYAANRAMMMIGGNDILMGVASGTWQANYQSIVSSLEGAGFQVWHCFPTPRTSLNLTALKDWINTTYGATNRTIDTWTPLLGSGTSLNATYDSGDGVHPNAAGHALIASTILDAIIAIPTITTQPSNLTKNESESATFTVVADGDPIPTYQWRKGGVNIGGATSASYNIPSVVAADAGSYDCVVTNSEGSVTSSAATLTVQTVPVITDQPDNTTGTEGGNVTLSLTATGSPSPTYQWKKNGVNVGGATSASINFNPLALGDAGTYTCVVTNAAGSVTSDPAVLTVNPAGTAPTITTEPVDASYTAGDTFHLTVVATGDPTLTYQWRKGGVNISGEVDATLYFAPASLSDAGSYDVVVTNPYGSDTSVSVTVTVVAPVPTTGSPLANGSGGTVSPSAGAALMGEMPSQAFAPLTGASPGQGFAPLSGAPTPLTFAPLTR